MNAKRVGLVVLIGVLVVLFAALNKTKAQGGTPHPPNLTSPGNGSTITNSNSFQLCATASDDMTSEIHFEIFQAPIPDFQTNWQGGNPVCTGINVPNGHYTWQARGRNSAGEGGASPAWTFTVQVGSAPPPTLVPGPEGPTAVPEPGPSFSWSFDPSGGAPVGSTVTIHVKVQCSPNCGEALVTVPCGGNDQTRNTSGDFYAHWTTNGCGAGNQTVKVCTRSVSDPQGQRANCQQTGYNLSGGNPTGASANFWADNTSLQQGQCTTIHWQTDNATSVNIDGVNVGANGDRQECPDKTKTYSLRATNPNGDATRSFTIQVSVGNPASNNTPPPPASGCTSRLHGGDIAVVSDYDSNPLKVYNERDVRSGLKFTIPIKEKVSIIQGPSCAFGVTWVEVGYNGLGGWAIEVNSQGYYNLIPNGMPLPGPGGSSNPQSGGQQGVPSTTQTNALGQPLIVLPNGDLVYPKATGSGGDLCVRDNINSLYLKVNPTTDSTNKNVIGTMTAGNCYPLIQISNGWAQVQTSLGNGWVKANPEWVIINQQVQPTVVPPTQVPVVPTATPGQQPPSSQQQGGNINCGELGYSPSSIPQVYADEPWCTQYVARVYPDLVDGCWKGAYPDAYLWAQKARDTAQQCGLSVTDSRDIREGDIVVWAQSCGYPNEKAGKLGHVAVLVSHANGMITVKEANWGPPAQPTRHIDPGCMTFIHVLGKPDDNKQTGQQGGQSSGSSNNGIASGSVTATKITWSFCIACTSHAWIEFTVPKGYDLSNYRLSFAGTDISVLDKSVSVNSDGSAKVTLHVSADTIQKLIDSGYGDKLNDLGNWRFFYIATK